MAGPSSSGAIALATANQVVAGTDHGITRINTVNRHLSPQIGPALKAASKDKRLIDFIICEA